MKYRAFFINVYGERFSKVFETGEEMERFINSAFEVGTEFTGFINISEGGTK
jgi:hypothetical protein